MHELSVCDAIVGTTLKRAEGRPVTQVTVRIGHLRQVVPDALQFGWEILTESTDLAGCTLLIEQVPADREVSGMRSGDGARPADLDVWILRELRR